jgi:hypothetical protein
MFCAEDSKKANHAEGDRKFLFAGAGVVYAD